MRRSRLCCVTGILRRAHGASFSRSLCCCHTSRSVATRQYNVMREDEPRMVSCSTGTGTVTAKAGEPTENVGWDDNTLAEDIGGVLHSLLLERPKTGRGPNADDNGDVSTTLPVHLLFRALGPPLRVQLQNSSFGALAKALQSKPEWFILCDGSTSVGLTDAGWLKYNGDCKGTPICKDSLGKYLPAERKGIISSSKRSVLVRGAFVTTPVDVSTAPLTSEDVRKWRLNRLILPLNLHFLLDREPVTLFPRGPKPQPLSSELAEVDALYSAKGFFPPCEVAAAFVHITPTFFVETRHVLNAMSPDVAQCLERCISKDRVVDNFFKKYPMIFKLKTGKFQKAVVKLDAQFEFIRNYPGFGRADRSMRQFNQEYRATVGGVVSRPPTSSSSSLSSPNELGACGQQTKTHIDVRIFEILVRNLPRVPTDPALSSEELLEKRCRPFPLVGWIDNFPQEDIDTLNSVPQQRVLTLLTRYVRIFQMMCHGEDTNLFTEHANLEIARRKSRGKMRPCHEDKGGDACDAPSSSPDAAGMVVESALHDDVPLPRGDVVAALEEKAGKSNLPCTDVEQREAALAGALRDDLIGLDDILSGSTDPSANTATATAASQMSACPDTGLKEDVEEMDVIEGTEEREREREGEGVDLCNLDGEFGRDAKGGNPCSVQHAPTDDKCSGPYIPSRYDIIYLRRIPKHIAPRSLSDYNAASSPEPELLQHIASFLNPPPSILDAQRAKAQPLASRTFVRFASKVTAGPWRWVPIQRIYASLSKEQKRLLRPYKGLVHFMRLHGEIFELSGDFMHVIAHDPEGQIPPFVPTQTVFNSEERVLLPPTMDDDENSKAALIGDAERNKFKGILGASQIPTDRQQLLLLDPLNPVLDHEVLCEEVSLLMPDHPVSLHQLMSHLPPILKAALSVRHRNNFKTSKHLTVWMDNNRMMLQKSKLASPESAMISEESIPVEDAIECVREVVPDEGVMFLHLQRMLPSSAKRTLREHFGDVYNALLGYPQYFYLKKDEADRFNSVLFLVERLQEEQ